MNKRQRELMKLQLKDEREVRRNLKIIYKQALEDVDGEVLRLRGGEETQSKIYQIKYQEQLKEQVNHAIDTLNKKQGAIINDHLKTAYTRGFIGTMYDFHGQGVPFLFPVDEKQVTKALFTNSKIKEGLYKRLGKDAAVLKKQIANEITRGIATGRSYHEISRNLGLTAKVGLGRTDKIVRTEGHRIQNEAAYEAGLEAKNAGADVVKQWDSTLDDRTRTSHRILDGQIRDLDEPFTLDGKEADHPGGFGIASEDINCRCAILHRAKWALDEDELNTLKERAEFHGLDKTDDFDDFQKKYLKSVENNSENDIIIYRSIGAAARNYDVNLPDGRSAKLAAGTKIVKIKTIAGKGTNVPIRVADKLEESYGEKASEWRKVRGEGVVRDEGQNLRAELHWYEAGDQRVDMKVKRYFDEG